MAACSRAQQVHTSLIILVGQYSNRFIRLEAALLLRLHGIISIETAINSLEIGSRRKNDDTSL